MMKWILILLGVVILVPLVVMLVLGVTIWNYERGYPKSILSDEAKGTCLVNRRSFVLLKRKRTGLNEDVNKILPIPDSVDHYYIDYTLGTFLAADGTEKLDLTGAIEVPMGTRFILKDGFKDQTINYSEYFYWLEPEGISLDSSYFDRSRDSAVIGSETVFYTDEEMSNFPDNDLFQRACDT